MSLSPSTRTISALPLLLLTAFMLYAFSFAEPIAPFYEPALASKVFTLNGVSVPILTSFYGLPVLDLVLSNICIGFTQLLSFPADPAGYWHLLLFLGEFAGVYGVLFLESCRGVYKGSWLRFPMMAILLGQFVCIGTVLPIYLFFLYTRTPSSSFTTADRFIPLAETKALLPALVLGYYSSFIPAVFHPDLAARHWWCWAWQLFPIWTSLAYIPLAKLFSTGSPAHQDKAYPPSPRVMRSTATILALLSTATYWYTLTASTLSLSEIILPTHLLHAPTDPTEALRTIVRYDYLTGYAAVLLWLGLGIRDVKALGLTGTSWGLVLVGGGVVMAVGGPGSMLILGWLWREEVLMAERGGRKDV